MKKFLTVLLLIGFVLALATTACDDGNSTPTHTHDYGTAWKSNAAQHWRECSCGDKTDVADHEWEWVVTEQATPTADGLETETCKTCGAESGNTRIIEQTEPTNKGPFPLSFNFANPAAVEAIRNTNIQDERTNCGSQNLEQLGIKTLIEQAILGAFNNEATTNGERARFRNVFGDGITIYVNNPVTLYKIKALDGNTIYFHIDYLKSSPADIQKNIFDLLGIMNDARANDSSGLPHEIE